MDQPQEIHLVSAIGDVNSFDELNEDGWRSKFDPELTYHLSESSLYQHYDSFGNGYIPYIAVIGKDRKLLATGCDYYDFPSIIAGGLSEHNLRCTTKFEDTLLTNSGITIDLNNHISSTANEVEYSVTSSNTYVATASIDGTSLNIGFLGNMGTSTITIIATSGDETLTRDFEVTVRFIGPISGSGYNIQFGDRTYSDHGKGDLISNLDKLSVEFYTKLDQLDTDQGFISKSNSSAKGWYIQITEENRVKFFVRADYSLRSIESNYTLEKDRWYHIAATYDGSTLTLYIDGEEDISEDFGNNLPITNVPSRGLRLGRDYKNYLFGSMDEISIWSKELSLNEIRGLMVTRADLSDEGLISSFNLNEGFGDQIIDITGNLNGTLYNYSNTQHIQRKRVEAIAVVEDSNESYSGKLYSSSYDNIDCTIAIENQPENGSFECNEDGEFTYSPNSGFNGNDYLKYKSVDSNGMLSLRSTLVFRVGDYSDIDECSIKTNDILKGYPNPFNPITTIEYNLESYNLLDPKIEIYNSLGEIVEVIKLNSDTPKGKIWFNGVSLSSGVYIVKVSTDKMVVDILKLNLLK